MARKLVDVAETNMLGIMCMVVVVALGHKVVRFDKLTCFSKLNFDVKELLIST